MPIEGQLLVFNKVNVDKAPGKPGVCGLYRGTTLIYIGSATKSVRTRLQCHLRGDEGPCTQRATAFVVQLSGAPVDLESALLIEFAMAHGRTPQCNEKMT